MTFGDDPDTEAIHVLPSLQQEEEFRIRIDKEELFGSSESLKAMIARLRKEFPFLDQWRLNSAQHGWGKSIIHFRNVGKTAIDEFCEPYMQFSNGSYEERPIPNDNNKTFSMADGLDPLAGGFSSNANAVSPINQLHVAEFSLQYLALFLLSSLVRYRPQIWTHAISRSTFQEIAPDDRALSLIEEFLELNSVTLPNLVSTILNPHEDAWFK